jgi:hypothetical protein
VHHSWQGLWVSPGIIGHVAMSPAQDPGLRRPRYPSAHALVYSTTEGNASQAAPPFCMARTVAPRSSLSWVLLHVPCKKGGVA